MYTKMMFGSELKQKVLQNEDIATIGEWSHSIYLEHIDHIDSDFREMLLTLNTMELGSQFAYSYQELIKIADDLIAGKEVKL